MKEGDVVRLKGHYGPLMVVRWARENINDEIISVTCEWFDVNLQIQSHDFRVSSLDKVHETS